MTTTSGATTTPGSRLPSSAASRRTSPEASRGEVQVGFRDDLLKRGDARSFRPAAPVQTGVAGRRSYLLVGRYDRLQTEGGWIRLHQEDFCQALARPPSAKYEHNRSGVPGPSLADMFGLVRLHMTARDITRLLDSAIFNVAVGNVDSHAKNYSILLRPGRPELAPLYDLMSGVAWANITQNHAQDIGGQQRGRHVYGRHWRRMAQACGLAAAPTVRRVGALAERVLARLIRDQAAVEGPASLYGEPQPEPAAGASNYLS